MLPQAICEILMLKTGRDNRRLRIHGINCLTSFLLPEAVPKPGMNSLLLTGVRRTGEGAPATTTQGIRPKDHISYSLKSHFSEFRLL